MARYLPVLVLLLRLLLAREEHRHPAPTCSPAAACCVLVPTARQ